MKVLLVDDHAVVRQGYQSLLQALMPEIEVIEAGSGTDALLLCMQQQPDVVVLDINMPDMSGVDVCRQMIARDPGIRVLMFSMYEEPSVVRECLSVGASGYLSKSGSPDRMVEALKIVCDGGQYMDDGLPQQVMPDRCGAPGVRATLDSLPTREREIADLLLEGKGNQAIADALGISAKTVANRATVIRQKLGVSSTAEMIRKVYQ